MIRTGKKEDFEVIYQLWKELFAFDDGGYTDYYFSSLFQMEDVLVEEVEGEVVACLQRRKHHIVIHDVEIPTSIIVGVMTHPKHRHKGYMKSLMNHVLENAKREEVLTVIQAYDMELYRPFGFISVSGKRKLILSGNGTTVLKNGYQAVPLYRCFQAAMQNENGYFKRDMDYFIQYEKELLAQGIQCKRLMHGQECKGYVLYQEVEGMILCSECMAVSKQAFFDLINGFQQSVEVIVPTHFCEEGMPCDNTLICIHDVKRLCELTHITKEEAVFFQTDGKTWYLPEWA